MKRKFDIYLICMTLVKFIFYSMVCWLALYAAYQYSETSLTLKIILGCGKNEKYVVYCMGWY